MRQTLKQLTAAAACSLFAACAAPQAVKYAVEAEKVNAQALEPVMLESAELEKDIQEKFGANLPSGAAENLIKVIQTEIATTGRFTKVFLNASEGDTYIIQPRIDDIREATSKIANDPTRNLHSVKARVRLDVLFVNQTNQKELVKSFYDERKLDNRFPARTPLMPEQKQEYVQRAVNTAFRAASDKLGSGFNPSYEMGTVSRVNGRTLHAQINTSRIRTMPRKQQAVEIVDDEGRVLAAVTELVLEDGSLSGRFFEKGNASISEGMKVRARVNRLTE